MKKSLVFAPSLLLGFAFASVAHATTWYVTPDGTATDGCFDRKYLPCDLGTAANKATAGDTVVLGDGVYQKQLYVSGSGTSSAWLTFQADDCATPIIQGPGVAPDADNQDAGVSSTTATYVKFVGLVSMGWSTGFGNGWVDTDATTSNGHFEFDDCIGDGNGRTGFTFYSAQGIKIKNSISAHNGSSTLHSWSSGITLYEAQGSPSASWLEGNISFENMDGSGFIIDEYSKGATFINNVAFRNGGSCLRLTESANTVFVNNTCYHDAQDMADTGPTNPSEVYFTKSSSDSYTTTGTTFMNNVLVATGVGPGAMAVQNQPTTGWANNSVTNSGSVSFFTDAEGTNPNFTLASGSMLTGKGGTGSSVPTTDIGFDPKCITKKAPTPIGMMVNGSWWQYSVDLDYIKSLGGVAKCFNPKMRSGTPDIGAYANGSVTTTTAGTCTKPPPFGTMQGPGLGSGGAGGMGSGAGGMSTGAGGMSTSAGGSAGAVSTGGTTSMGTGGTMSTGTGGTSTGTGGTNTGTGGTATGTGGTTGTGTGGTATGTGGTTGTGTGGTTSTGTGGTTATGTGGTMSAAAGSSATNTSGGSSGSDSGKSGCGCRVAGDEPHGAAFALFGLVGLAGFGLRRRRG